MDVLAKRVRMPRSRIGEVLENLRENGKIEKKGTKWNLLELDSFLSTGTKQLAKTRAKMKKNPTLWTIKILLTIIGIGATSMSIYHSRFFLLSFYTPGRAIFSGIIMIGFNIMAAEMAVYFWILGMKSLSVLFGFLLFLGTLFSMGSTVMGLYQIQSEELKESIAAENIEIQENHQMDLQYQALVDNKEMAMASLKIEQEKLSGIIAQMNNQPNLQFEDPAAFRNLNGRRWAADQDIEAAQANYDRASEALSEFLSGNEVVAEVEEEPPSMYDWIAGTVFKKFRPEVLQFSMTCYPALFYDIIAPVSFSIVFFFTGAKKKKAVRKKRKGK